jgi:thiamine pyrophosphate-dependent enzyme
VPYVFSLCGHRNVSLLDALYDRPDAIKTISTRHEQTAGHMADAYFACGRSPGTLRLVQVEQRRLVGVLVEERGRDLSPWRRTPTEGHLPTCASVSALRSRNRCSRPGGVVSVRPSPGPTPGFAVDAPGWGSPDGYAPTA